MKGHFRAFAKHAAFAIGTPWAFVAACAVVLGWAVLGPVFGFSDTWQLVINTGTTIITFLAVFLIQNTQNRDAQAVHLKLDELIRSMKQARNSMIDLEDCTDEEIARLKVQFERLRLGAGGEATDVAEEREARTRTERRSAQHLKA